MTNVKIISTDDSVRVIVTRDNTREKFDFGTGVGDGWLTGADLEQVLDACGVRVQYRYAGSC